MLSVKKSAFSFWALAFIIMLCFSLTGCDELTSAERDGLSLASRSGGIRAPLSDVIKREGIEPNSSFNIYVNLKTRILMFRHEDKVLKRYSIGTGQKTALGNKNKEGDMRTPRGEFYICSKEAYDEPRTVGSGSLGTRWMQLSFPNIEVAERGLEDNSITEEVYNQIVEAIENKKIPPQNTPLGSAIGIHGGSSRTIPRRFTAGCIGMYDRDVEEIFKYLKNGDRVQIIWGDEE